MTEETSGKDPEEKSILPDYSKITLEQLLLFVDLLDSGSQIEVSDRYEGVSTSKLSKIMKELRLDLRLSHLSDKEFWLSDEAHLLKKVFTPLRELLDQFCNSKQTRIVTIGAGGSLLAWLVGKKSNDIRRLCSSGIGVRQDRFQDTRLSCTPYTNRDILSHVTNGLLDFGFVRSSLLEHSRSTSGPNPTIISRLIGEVHYGIAVPYGIKKSWDTDGTMWNLDDEGFLKNEKSILNTGYFVSVGPEGEFKDKLQRALIDWSIDLKVEFNYKSFPQIIPHVLEGTHFGLCPIFRWWHGREESNQHVLPLDDPDRFEEIPGADVFPLRLLDGYKREIKMIWHKDLEIRKPWIDTYGIAQLLKSGWLGNQKRSEKSESKH